ncbi:MAG: TM7S3/TM198-like domain-containing protein [Planctomycetota bacterium]|jgi:hypothetical protein
MTLQPIHLFAANSNALLLLLVFAWGVANCFLGYPLFRVLLAVVGALAGLAGGVDLVHAVRGEGASTGDFLVACLALAILGGLLSWYLYRMFFSLAAGWLAAALVAAMFGSSTVGWVIGGVLGLACGILAYNYLRSAIIFVTALAGAVGCVYAAALLVTGGRNWEGLMDATLGKGKPWVAWFLALVAVGLTALGMAVQGQLSHAVGERFMPRPRRRGKRGPSGSTEVQPRFSKL